MSIKLKTTTEYRISLSLINAFNLVISRPLVLIWQDQGNLHWAIISLSQVRSIDLNNRFHIFKQ